MNTRDAISRLKDDDSHGLTLLKSVDVLTKGQCFAWEFDTVFEHLAKEHSIELSVHAADRLMACLAAKANPSFLWDVSVFQGIVQSLNGSEAITDTVVQCSTGECAWAVTELRLLGEEYNLDYSKEMYNDDPSLYIAACAAQEGYMCMPEELSFCDEEFDRLFPLSKRPQKEAINKIRLAAKKSSPMAESLDEDSHAHLQVRKLQEVSLYVSEKTKSLLSSIT